MQKKNMNIVYIQTLLYDINAITGDKYDLGFRTNRHVLVLYEDNLPIARGIYNIKRVVELLHDRYLRKVYEEAL